MSPQEWFGLTAGLALAVALLVAVRAGLTGGRMRSELMCDLSCPKTHEGVSCGVVRDLRIGQWQQVHSCSAFANPEQVECGQDCRKLVNMGVIVPQIRPA